MRESDKEPALDVEIGVVGARALRREPDRQPVERRVAELGPVVEEVLRRVVDVNDVLPLAVELEALPGQSQLEARRRDRAADDGLGVRRQPLRILRAAGP